MKHNEGITKDRTSLQNRQKDKRITYQGGCQETQGNITGAAGIAGKCWLFPVCDNILY